MAYDSELMTDILNIFVRAAFGELRRRARRGARWPVKWVSKVFSVV